MVAKKKSVKTRSIIKGSGGGRVMPEKYDAVKEALLAVIPRAREGIAVRDLPRLVAPKLPRTMLPRKGSASWLVTTVKLDLEARGVIERIPGVVPQRLRRVK